MLPDAISLFYTLSTILCYCISNAVYSAGKRKWCEVKLTRYLESSVFFISTIRTLLLPIIRENTINKAYVLGKLHLALSVNLSRFDY